MNSKQRRKFHRLWKYSAAIDSSRLEYNDQLGIVMTTGFNASSWCYDNIGHSHYMNYQNSFRFKSNEHLTQFLLRWGNELV